MSFDRPYMISYFFFRCNYVSILHRFQDIIAYFLNLKTSRDRDYTHSKES